MFNRFFCVCMALALCLAALPLTVSAATDGERDQIALDHAYTHTWTADNVAKDYSVTFTVPEDGIVTIDAAWPTDNGGDRGDVIYTLYEADAAAPLWNGETYYCDKEPATYTLSIGLRAGIYRLSAMPDFRVTQGQIDHHYTIRYTATAYTECEPNDTKATATPMTLGLPYHGSMNELRHSYDYWSYTADSGDVRRLYFSAWDQIGKGGKECYLYHIDSDGTKTKLSAADLTEDVNGDPCLILPATAGTNTIYLSYYPGAPIDYTLRVTPPVPLNLISGPSDAAVYDGETVTVRVKASGESLSYSWWLCDKGSTKFSRSSIKTDTYTVTMNEVRDGRRLYCVITDAYGVKVTTETVTIRAVDNFKITKHPQNTSAPRGATFHFTVKASGSGLSYQWYVAGKDSNFFKKSSVTGTHYSAVMSDASDGRRVYCIVTDSRGRTLSSAIATVTMRTPRILTQPTDAVAKLGDYATTVVQAEGEGLTYQWYVKDAGSNTFKKSSVTSKNYSYAMTLAKSGRQVYCIVTNQYGDTVQSDTVTMSLPPLTIVTQPTNASAAVGSTVTTVIKAAGDGLSYQWYVKDPGASSFVKSSVRSVNYSFTMTAAKSGRQVYCIVTDAYGQTVQSDTAVLSKA